MSTDIVGGLFGINPIGIQNQTFQEQSNRANQFAQLDPFQRSAYGMSMAGQQLGQAIGGLMGVEDPRLKTARNMEMAKKYIQENGIDVSTSEGLNQLAQYLNSIGETEGAISIGQQATKMAHESAQTVALLREKKGTAQNQAEQAIYDKFVAQFGPDQGAIAFSNWKNSMELQQKAAGRTVVNVNQQQESQFAKTLGEKQAERLGKAYEAREAAVDQLGTLKKMSDLNEQQLISGSYASGRVGAANLLVTMGLASPEDVTRLSNSQQFAKLSKDLVVANLKKMGYNPSNADQQFISATVAQLETSPQARAALIKFQADRANGAIAETNRMETYGVKNKSLNGYVPIIPNFNPTGNTGVKTGLQDLSNEELAAQIARLKRGNK